MKKEQEDNKKGIVSTSSRRFKETVKKLKEKKELTLTKTYDTITKQQSNMEKVMKGQND